MGLKDLPEELDAFLSDIENNSVNSANELLLALELNEDDELIQKIISSLILLAHQNNAVAYLALAKIYAGNWFVIEQEEIILPQLSLNMSTRESLAVGCARKAMELGSDEARIFLLNSLTSGRRGCIGRNNKLLMQIYENLIKQNHQAALFELGSLFLNFKIPEHMGISEDYKTAISYLLKAIDGKNLIIANLALNHLFNFLCHKMAKNNQQNSTLVFFETHCQKEQIALLALYLAYVFAPAYVKTAIEERFSQVITQSESQIVFPDFLTYWQANVDHEKMNKYLTIASKNNGVIADMARWGLSIANSSPAFRLGSRH